MNFYGDSFHKWNSIYFILYGPLVTGWKIILKSLLLYLNLCNCTSNRLALLCVGSIVYWICSDPSYSWRYIWNTENLFNSNSMFFFCWSTIFTIHHQHHNDSTSINSCEPRRIRSRFFPLGHQIKGFVAIGEYLTGFIQISMWYVVNVWNIQLSRQMLSCLGLLIYGTIRFFAHESKDTQHDEVNVYGVRTKNVIYVSALPQNTQPPQTN